jgi:mannose-6-phosphate isomerase-like protein (cupin superfamily)
MRSDARTPAASSTTERLSGTSGPGHASEPCCSYTVIVRTSAGCGRSARRWYHAARVSETAIPFLSRRRERALVAQKVPHVLGALALFGDGVLRAQHETQTYGWVLSGAEVLASTLVLAAFVYAFAAAVRAKPGDREPEHPSIDWVDLLLAAMFAVEAIAHHHETNHWPRPTVLLAATMFVLAILHGPIATVARRRRGLIMSNKGLRVGRPFRRFRAEWSVLKPITVGARWAVVETIDGRVHKIDLSDLGNEGQVREALREAEVLRTAKRRFSPKSPLASAQLREPAMAAAAPSPVPAPAQASAPPTLLAHPAIIQAAGSKPKTIEEYAGRVNSGHRAVSVARMVSPEGWVEPGQQPEFEEITVVLRGMLRVEHRGGALDVHAGQAVVSHPGEWIRYSSPEPGGAEYVAICLPAFSPDTVHRDP